MDRSNVSPRWVAAVIVTVAGLLLAWGLYASIEFYDETVESGWSTEAIRNPYLAAQQFIRQSGIGVEDVDSLVALESLEGIGTLFVSEPNQVAIPRQLRRIRAWLESGGSVIYTANSGGAWRRFAAGGFSDHGRLAR